jgi:midasin
MKVKIDCSALYKRPAALGGGGVRGFESVVWTQSLQRLWTLVGRCLEHREPVLLVGETGCGKTTVCQMWAEHLGRRLHIVNCHQHTETADFLGGLRPVRGREHIESSLRIALADFFRLAAAVRLVELSFIRSLSSSLMLLCACRAEAMRRWPSGRWRRR